MASQGACAIDISFSASNGGGTVGIVDSYDVDDSVGVSGRSSASFGDGVSMTDDNSLSGSGDAKVDQVFYGSGFGADYVAEYALRTLDASSIEAGGSASLTPDSSQISKSASTTDGITTFARLRGRQNGDFAAVGSFLFIGDLTATQNLVTGQSVTASQNTLSNGLLAWSYGWAVDGDGCLAWTNSLMMNGNMRAGQTAESGNSARSSQTSEIEASLGRAGSGALDAEGNFAWTFAEVLDGEGEGVLVTEQSAEAGGSAEASQVTSMAADRGGAASLALDDDGNIAATEADMVNGTLGTDQGAWAGDDGWLEGADAGQWTEITADRGAAESIGEDAEGNEAWTWVAMANGTIETDQGAWAGDNGWFEGADADQWTEITADRGAAESVGEDAEGNEAWTWAEMTKGTLETYQGAWAGDDWWLDEGAEAYQFAYIEAEKGLVETCARDSEGNFAFTGAAMDNGTLVTEQGALASDISWLEGAVAEQFWTIITAENGSARSYAEDVSGSYVEIFAVVEDGDGLITEQWAEATNSARGYQKTLIVGNFAYAFCEANSTGNDYFAYVDNWVNGSALLTFVGEASVDNSEARAHQVSHAEGDRIWPWANSTNDHDEEDTTGSHDFESLAWTNGTGEYADVEQLT